MTPRSAASGRRRMNDMPDWMKSVAWPTLIQGKKVLAVEGDDDRAVYKAWLEKLTQPGTIFSDRVVLVDAGNKIDVLQGLTWFRDLATKPLGTIYGLVE
jgi:hypothetical protein